MADSGIDPTTGEWQPQFTDQRPPFEVGNVLAVRDGVDSERIIAAEARARLAELAEEAPWITELDRPALETLVKAEVVASLWWRRVMRDGAKPWEWEKHFAAERRLDRVRASLGLTPSSRAALTKDTAVARAMSRSGLAAVQERGQAAAAAVLAADGRSALPAGDDGGSAA